MNLSPTVRGMAGWVAGASASLLFLLALLRFLTAEPAPAIHVAWRDGLAADQQHALERRFALVRPEHLQDQSWAYDLLDLSRENIEALVRHPDVRDTHEIDRSTFEVSGAAPYGKSDTWIAYRVPWIKRPGRVTAIVWVLATALLGSVLALRLTDRRE